MPNKPKTVLENPLALARYIIGVERDRMNAVSAAQPDPKTPEQYKAFVTTGVKIEALNNALFWLETFECPDDHADPRIDANIDAPA